MALVPLTDREVVTFIVDAATPLLPGHRIHIGASGDFLRITRLSGDWFEAGLGFSINDGSFHMHCVKRPLFLPGPHYMAEDLPGPGWLGRLRPAWSLRANDPSRLRTALRSAIQRRVPGHCYRATSPPSFAATIDIPYRDDIVDEAEVLEASAYAHLIDGTLAECIKRLDLVSASVQEEGDMEELLHRTRRMADLCRREPSEARADVMRWRDQAVAEFERLPSVTEGEVG